MVIANVGREGSVQRTLPEDDHVIEAFAANGANQPFYVGPLPRRSRCGEHLLDPHPYDLVHEFFSEDAIPITQQIPGRVSPGKGFPQLLSRPLRSRVHRYGEVYDSPALMRQDEKHIKNLKPNRRHREEVY